MLQDAPIRKVGFDVISAVDNLASQVRREREDIGLELDFDKQRQDIGRRIIEAAQVRGESFTPDDVEKATDLYFQRQSCFVEPRPDSATRFAQAYVDRKRLGIKYGIPAFTILLATTLSFGAINLSRNAAELKREKNAEILVEMAYNDRSRLIARIQDDVQTLSTKELSAADTLEISGLIEDAKRRVLGTDDFFKKFCSDGTATDDIDRQNYNEVATPLEDVNSNLQIVDDKLRRVDDVFALQARLASVKGGLEALMQEVKSNNPPQVFSNRATTAYESGLADVSSRNLSEAQGHEAELRTVISDIKQFTGLPSEAEKAYAAIKTIAKEPIAIQKAEKFHSEAQVYIKQADVPRLSETVQGMKQLSDILNQEYSLRVVSKPGVKSGIDRYYNGRFSGWYLVVEAVDTHGNIVPVNIVNSENGAVSRTTMWGERVSGNDPNLVEKIQGGYKDNSLLVSVIMDKMDNGVVDNNLVGEKARGYLNYQLNSRDFEGKQITAW